MTIMDPNVGNLALVLEKTYDPFTRKQAEDELRVLEQECQELGLWLMQVAGGQYSEAVRLGAAIQLKNYIGRKWEHEPCEAGLIPFEVRIAIKGGIVDLAILAPPRVQAQLREAVSTIASWDFPGEWPQLFPSLVQKLNGCTDFNVISGVLVMAHSIMKKWESEAKSDPLMEEIKTVLSMFSEPYLALFRQLNQLIAQHSSSKEAQTVLYQSLFIMVRIFYSFCFQDLPEFFEDNLAEFMDSFYHYLTASNSLLVTDNDEEAGIEEKVKGAICSVADLFAKMYEPEFVQLPKFVEATWQLLTTIGPEPKYDLLVCKDMSFLTTIVKQERHKRHFESPEVLCGILKRIVLPNMRLRDSDEELLEDNPIEFIRRDLEASDSDTRRRAATDFVRGLLERFAEPVTRICSELVGNLLETYKSTGDWKAKDTALFVVTALSARSVVQSSGATSVNEFMQITTVFAEQVLPELQGDSAHPILIVDALKYLMLFRSQLSKEQLLQVIPLVVRQLENTTDYVVCTYASFCLERILALRNPDDPLKHLLLPEDISTLVGPCLRALLVRFDQLLQEPTKLAENDYLMRSVMRLVISSGSALIVPLANELLPRLLTMVEVTSKNPSNPKFNHYLFETVGVFVKLAPKESAVLVVPSFLKLLSSDALEFLPYLFQILAQLLESVETVSNEFSQLLAPLLQPTLWDITANVPPLVRLLKAYLSKDAHGFIQRQQLPALLGVFQKLLSVKSLDQYSFEFLESLFSCLPLAAMQPYYKSVVMLLLNRLSSGKTNKFVHGFLHFVLFCSFSGSSTGKQSGATSELTADSLISIIDSIQPALFSQLVLNVLVPHISESVISLADRRLCLIGFTELLNTSQIMRNEPYVTTVVPKLVTALSELASKKMAESKVTLGITSSQGAGSGHVQDIDDEELVSGLGTSTSQYARLVNIAKPPLDITSNYPTDAREFFKSQLSQNSDVVAKLNSNTLQYLQ